MQDYIVKQRSLCLLSEIAETISIAYVKILGCLFIWLYENTGAVDDELPRSINSKKRKTSPPPPKQAPEVHFFINQRLKAK